MLKAHKFININFKKLCYSHKISQIRLACVCTPF